jgi:hypothetical protein
MKLLRLWEVVICLWAVVVCLWAVVVLGIRSAIWPRCSHTRKGSVCTRGLWHDGQHSYPSKAKHENI